MVTFLRAETLPPPEHPLPRRVRKPQRQPNMIDYVAHVHGQAWRRQENRIVRAHPSCWACGAPSMRAHHLDIDRLGQEGPWDVVAVCEGCHAVLISALAKSASFAAVREQAWILRREMQPSPEYWPRTRAQRWWASLWRRGDHRGEARRTGA